MPTERALTTALHLRCVAQFYPEPACARPARCFLNVGPPTKTSQKGSPTMLFEFAYLGLQSFSLGGFKNINHGLPFPEDFKRKSLS